MVLEGIVLGHKISARGIEVDIEKIDVIEKLPPPINVKGIRSFLGHVDFYWRFIKDFSKIAKPLTNFLNKDATFKLDEEFLVVFQTLKDRLVSAPVMVALDWSKELELMRDASDYAVGVVLGQQRDKIFRTICYAARS